MQSLYRTTSLRMFAAVELTGYLRAAVTVLLTVAAALVVSRRLAGALETPLGPLLLLVTGAILAGLAHAGRVGFSPPSLGASGPKPFLQGLGSVLNSLALLVIAASLSLPGSHPVGLLGLWGLVAGHELWTWWDILPKRRSISPLAPGEGGHHVPMVAVGGRAESADAIEDPESAEPDEDVLQQLTLRTTAEGGQELSGWLRIRLAVGQRTGSLHVAFCPAFEQAPQVEVQPVSGPDCRIKMGQILPYGARLDFKLDEPSPADDSVLVWFSCTSGIPA